MSEKPALIVTYPNHKPITTPVDCMNVRRLDTLDSPRAIKKSKPKLKMSREDAMLYSALFVVERSRKTPAWDCSRLSTSKLSLSLIEKITTADDSNEMK